MKAVKTMSEDIQPAFFYQSPHLPTALITKPDHPGQDPKVQV
jgi:hypothetical protein